MLLHVVKKDTKKRGYLLKVPFNITSADGNLENQKSWLLFPYVRP